MKNFDSVQVEQLKDIGQYLHKERQERSVSLEEIAVKTYIPLRLLRALETEELERLPEPVFVQGFIRRYADALGLDGMALAKTFSTEPANPSLMQPSGAEAPIANKRDSSAAEPAVISTSVTPTAPAEAPTAPAEKIAYAESKLPANPLSGPTLDESSRPQRPYLPLLLGGIGVAVLLGSIAIGAYNRARSPETPGSAERAPNSLNTQDTQSSGVRPNSSPQSTNSPSKANPPASNPAAPVQVAVNLVGDSWMQIDIDGKTEFDGILKKGTQRTWAANKKLVLTAGNAGAVSVSYNQGKAKLMGAPGEVKDATFTPQQPKSASPN